MGKSPQRFVKQRKPQAAGGLTLIAGSVGVGAEANEEVMKERVYLNASSRGQFRQ